MTISANGRAQTIPEPLRQRLLADRSSSHLLHHIDGVNLGVAQALAIIHQKDAGDHPRRALIAVAKAMVARQAIRIGSSQSGRIRYRLAIGGQLLCLSQRRFHCMLIAQTDPPAMPRQLHVMHRVHQGELDPAPQPHCTNTRRISRSSYRIQAQLGFLVQNETLGRPIVMTLNVNMPAFYIKFISRHRCETSHTFNSFSFLLHPKPQLAAQCTRHSFTDGGRAFCRFGNRPQPCFNFLTRRLRCNLLFECGSVDAGRRQRFLDRGQAAAPARQLGGQ